MKIFVRKSDLAEGTPRVLAVYKSDQPVNENTHGEDCTMLEVPDGEEIPLYKEPRESARRLKEGWRERLTEPILHAEAKRRADAALSPLEQFTTLREVIELTLQHGTDVSRWPSGARDRKAEIDEAWDYVRQVKERVHTMKSLPASPSSDKNWPARFAKKK